MSEPRHILVVDDEPQITRVLRTSLTAHGYEVRIAHDGESALELMKDWHPDLLITDLAMPNVDGVELCRRVRHLSEIPIIVLSVREAEKIKVEALDAGADDYVTKPFGIDELVARLRTALRHRLQQEGAVPIFRSGSLMVDLVHRVVKVNDEDVHLSPREYDILKLLVTHAGKVLTHRHILGKLWGASGDVQQLRVYVRQIRQKIEADPERPAHILTETGVGYRLAARN